MKLIATLGATKVELKHKYIIDNIEYKEYFSFLALKKYYKIEDKQVVVIGTKKTKEVLFDYIKEYNFLEVDETSFENIFKKSIEVFEKDDILDLTQSFRTIPFVVFLSLSYSKILGKNVKDIFYAQIKDANCNIKNEICEFEFISLKQYDNMIDLTRTINTFLLSWFVIDSENVFKNLFNLSKKLLANNIEIKNEILDITKDIDYFKSQMPFLNSHLEKLNEEIKKLNSLLLLQEHKQLLEFSKLYLEKNLLLQSLTMLFEAILAYLDKKYYKRFFKDCNINRYNKTSSTYERRNCIKNKFLNSKRKFGIYKESEFKMILKKIDRLRNQSAHAFIDKSSEDDFYKEITEKIKKVTTILI